MRLRSLLGPIALAIVVAACGSEKERSYTSPDIDDGFVQFAWPSADQPLPKAALRIDGPLVVFYDTAKSAGVPAEFKVWSGATDVTKDAKWGVRDTIYGGFTGATFTPKMSPSDPVGVSTLIGVKVGDAVAFAHLVVVQQARSGTRLDATAISAAGVDAAPADLTMKVGGGINRVDVALVIDTTGTMASSIDDIKTNLQTKIVPDLQKNIPDLAIGLAEHRDYPVGSYGSAGTDFVVKFHHTMTQDIGKVRATLGTLDTGSGNDLPEGQMPAMLHTLTGAELKWSGGSVPARPTPAGRLGAIGFRPGALPVLVLVTDDVWHEEGGPDPYAPDKVFTHVAMPTLADAFKKLNARFVDVSIEGKEAQAERLSDLTGSSVPPSAFGGACGEGKCCTGLKGAGRDPSSDGRCRLNFLHNKGEGVSDSLTKAIQGISSGSIFDVRAGVKKGPAGPDVTKLVQTIAPIAAGDSAAACPAHETFDSNGDGTADAYRQVPATKAVCFKLGLAKNSLVPATVQPQVTSVYLDVVGDPGQVLLDRRTVVFVVPPAP